MNTNGYHVRITVTDATTGEYLINHTLDDEQIKCLSQMATDTISKYAHRYGYETSLMPPSWEDEENISQLMGFARCVERVFSFIGWSPSRVRRADLTLVHTKETPNTDIWS